MTHREIERSPLVRDRFPALAAMERQVANMRVRTTGTLGGNLCFSDPQSDPATFLLALDAEVECQGRRPARSLPIREFVVGPYQTALAHDELLTSVRIPIPGPDTAVIHRKFAPHELPTATVTCRARVTGGAIAEAAIAVGSVGPVPIRAAAAERRLVGVATSDAAALAEAGTLAAGAAGATEDANGSPEYKTHVVAVLVERALRAALGLEERAGA